MLLWTLGCMYLFEIVVLVFLNIYPGVELLGHMVVLFLVFWETSILFSTVAVPIYIPPSSVQGFFFSTSSPTFVIHVLFDDSHSDRCEVIPHCGSICISLMTSDVRFSCPCWQSAFPLWKNVYSVRLPIF